MSKDRKLPAAIEAEKGIIGVCLRDHRQFALIRDKIRESDFFSGPNRTIWRTFLEKHGAGQAWDEIVIRDALAANYQERIYGGDEYIADLIDVGSAAQMELYATLVRERAALRDLLSVSSEITEEAYDSSSDPSELLERARDRMAEIMRNGLCVNQVEPINKTLDAFLQDIDSPEWKGRASGILSGYASLDTILSGFHRGQLYYVAGRPGMGKSTFLANCLRQIAVEQSIPAYYFSMECDRETWTQNMVCQVANMNPSLLNRIIDKPLKERLKTATKKISEGAVFIDDIPNPTVNQIRAKVRESVDRFGVVIAFVDYIQLIRTDARNKGQSREQEVSDISKGLKALARECNVALVVAAQLNRKVEEREDKRPQVSDLRESGALENDADAVILIYRPGHYKSEAGNGTELIVGKNRFGERGTAHVLWDSETLRFNNQQFFGG